ncbi:MAG: phosphatase PAP2 family protein, partial [Planctomycetes bacterium]|nr:phosphatase PAP2 family protein [Planctomycetota bacterium]
MRFPALVTLLVFAIGTVAAWLMDDAVRAWFRGPGIGGAPVAHQLRAPLEGVVEAQLYIVVPGILIALPNRRRLLIGWGVAMLLMLAMTHGTKFAVGRARPHMNQSPETFEPWIADSRMKSFPSGHTSAAIAGAVL